MGASFASHAVMGDPLGGMSSIGTRTSAAVDIEISYCYLLSVLHEPENKRCCLAAYSTTVKWFSMIWVRVIAMKTLTLGTWNGNISQLVSQFHNDIGLEHAHLLSEHTNGLNDLAHAYLIPSIPHPDRLPVCWPPLNLNIRVLTEHSDNKHSALGVK